MKCPNCGYDFQSTEITARERQILELSAKGMNGPAIALELGITRHTVKAHRANIVRKLGLKLEASFTQAVVLYLADHASPKRT